MKRFALIILCVSCSKSVPEILAEQGFSEIHTAPAEVPCPGDYPEIHYAFDAVKENRKVRGSWCCEPNRIHVVMTPVYNGKSTTLRPETRVLRGNCTAVWKEVSR
jgi:hypothetical protein